MTIRTGKAVNRTVYLLAAVLNSGLLASMRFFTSSFSSTVGCRGFDPTLWLVLLAMSSFGPLAPTLLLLMGGGVGCNFAATTGLVFLTSGVGADGLDMVVEIFFPPGEASVFFLVGVVFAEAGLALVDAARVVFFTVVTEVGSGEVEEGSAFFLEDAFGFAGSVVVLVLIFFFGTGEAVAAGLTGRAVDFVEARRVIRRSGRPTLPEAVEPLLSQQLEHRAANCAFIASHDMLLSVLGELSPR